MLTALQDHLEALLLAERDRTNADLNQTLAEEAEAQSVSAGGLARRQWTKAEFASDVQEQEADFVSATRLSAHLAEIDEALELLASNRERFGQCERCSDSIERLRLELVPWSRLCAHCAGQDGVAPDVRR
jgi:RNA polymerase-binding transcription factor DksA